MHASSDTVLSPFTASSAGPRLEARVMVPAFRHPLISSPLEISRLQSVAALNVRFSESRSGFLHANSAEQCLSTRRAGTGTSHFRSIRSIGRARSSAADSNCSPVCAAGNATAKCGVCSKTCNCRPIFPKASHSNSAAGRRPFSAAPISFRRAQIVPRWNCNASRIEGASMVGWVSSGKSR